MLDPTLVRPSFKPVGITKGPGENAHEYTFVSRDDEQVLKNGEYVYYELIEPGNVGVPLAGTRFLGHTDPGNVAGTRPSGHTDPGNVAGTRPSGHTDPRNVPGTPTSGHSDP